MNSEVLITLMTESFFAINSAHFWHMLLHLQVDTAEI